MQEGSVNLVIIDFCGKIPRTLVSNKLKMYIANIPEDWKEEIAGEILKEIRQQKFDILESIVNGTQSYEMEYSLSHLQNIIRFNINADISHEINSIEKCVQYLVDNMICLYFDYEDEDMPFFDWETNCFETRCCEEDYAEKIINFINFIHRDLPDEIHVNIIYSSNDVPFQKTRILFNLGFKMFSGRNYSKNINDSINKILDTGKKIDSFLKSETEYYKLDYLINGIYKDNSYNQNHYLKSFSLLELVLLKPYQQTNEVDKLLIPYLSDRYGEDSIAVVKLLRQMRNKIGHGDFKGFNSKAEFFAQQFMINFHFDYAEYSRLNWILLHTCCLLDDLLRAILFDQLTNT